MSLLRRIHPRRLVARVAALVFSVVVALACTRWATAGGDWLGAAPSSQALPSLDGATTAYTPWRARDRATYRLQSASCTEASSACAAIGSSSGNNARCRRGTEHDTRRGGSIGDGRSTSSALPSSSQR